MSIPDNSNNIPPALFTKYFEKKSLKELIQNLEQKKEIQEFDSTQRFIMMYGILLYLNSIHQDDLFHGRLKLSNIFLDSSFEVKVADQFLYQLNFDEKLNNFNSKMIDYIVSLPPEVYTKNKYTSKSDIYSFGIILLQILIKKINIYSDLAKKPADILRLKSEDRKPNFPDIQNEQLKNTIKKCLSFDPDERPTAAELIKIFDDISSDEKTYNVERLNNFKSKYHLKINFISQKLIEIKKSADNNDIQMMYEYGLARLFGDDCTKSIKEGMRYIKKAADSGFEKAKLIISHNDISNPEDEVKSDETILSNVVTLMNDNFFKREKFVFSEKIDTNQLINDIIDTSIFNETNLHRKGFGFTLNAISKISKLYNYIEIGVPVLVEGPTATSKTISIEVACQLSNRKLIKINCCSENNPFYLINNFLYDQNSLKGISMAPGQFVDAYKNGHTILLDQIDLANQECLQFIAKALDSKVLSIDIPGKPFEEIKMHENFRLVATMNSINNHYTNKRQSIDTKVLSRFQVISFSPFNKSEYKEIVNKFCASLNYAPSSRLIKDLINFHVEWCTIKDIDNDTKPITVREICSTIHAIANKKSIYDSIMTVYGARYPNKEKLELKSLLLSTSSFKKLKPSRFDYPQFFSECFLNKNLKEALNYIFFAFKNKQNVLLIGKKGSGITQVARWVAQCYDKQNSPMPNDQRDEFDQPEFFCICTNGLKCSDLIGYQEFADQNDFADKPIAWKRGILLRGIEDGKCVVLDRINEVPPEIAERINQILDEKYNDEPKIINIPENPNNQTITINSNFRLICTCHDDELEQMSPAFINRFNIVYLDDQLDGIKEYEMKNLIMFLLKNDSTSRFLEQEKIDEDIIEYEDEDDKESEYSDISENTDSDSNDDSNNDSDDISENYSFNNSTINVDDDEDKHIFDDIEKNYVIEKGNKSENTEKRKHSNKKKTDKSDLRELIPISDDDEKKEFEPSDNLINLIFGIYDHTSSISKLSQLCKSVRRLILFFSNDEKQLPPEITEEIIVKYVNYLIMNTEGSENRTDVPNQIQSYIINYLESLNAFNNGYFYKESPALCNYISKFFIYSILNVPVCVQGKPGVGKTLSTQIIAQMRTNINKTKIPYRFHSFNTETNPNNLYVSKKAINGNTVFVNEELTNSIENGLTFIADKIHLLNENTLKALDLTFEPYALSKIYIPGMNNPITIHPNFSFIAIKNDKESLPLSSISSYIRTIDYPILNGEEISNICLSIARRVYNNGNRSFSDEQARKIGRYMIELNKMNILPQWTFHDVERLIRRIHYQDKNPNNFYMVNIFHHILYYTLSHVNEKDIDTKLDPVCDLIGKVFSLSTDERNKLKNCYNAKPRINSNPINSGRNDLFIMKDEIGISTANLYCFNNHKNEFSSLPTLLDSIFKILISDSHEPILLSGPSGYKTFLSQLFSDNPNIIYLSPENSIQNQFGIQTYYSDSEVKQFYLDLLCKIYHIDANKTNALKQKLNNKQLNRSDINPGSNSINYILDANIINHLFDKFFSEKIEHCNQSLLSNYSLEYKPGPILQSIIEGKSFVLKNISNISPTVLDVIDELQSEKPILTLKEDYSHTFTKNDDESIINPNSDFRIFAIYSTNKEAKLPETVLSKFTKISIKPYNEDETINVIRSYNSFYQRNFSDELIQQLINFSKSLKNNLEITLSLSQMINALDIYHRIDPKPNNEAFGVILYRIAFGMIDKRNNYNQKIETVFNEARIPVPCFIQKIPRYENPFTITTSPSRGLQSKVSKVFLNSPNAKEAQLNIEYIPPFIHIVDIIHLGFSSNVPVILEGKPGQGKEKAVELIAQQLGFDIVNIVISKSTNVDDLFGKITLETNNVQNVHFNNKLTKLSKAIQGSINISKTIFVFHNLNMASPAVIEEISTLFDRNQKEILLPDGKIYTKSRINFIGIINNSKKEKFNRAKLPSPLLYSSIYHIVDDFRMQDVLSVTLSLFNSLFDKPEYKDFKNEAIDFYKKYETIQKISYEMNASPELTIRDVIKYIQLRKETYSLINRKFLYMIIFGYRFYRQEVIDKALANIKLSDMNFLPIFEFDESKKEVYFKESKNSKGICLQMKTYSNAEVEQAKVDLKSLTISQQKCMLFLACAIQSKQTCLIQGTTGSGKTHVIRLFAKMLGQKLNIYQMNETLDFSMFTDKHILSNETNSADEREIKSAFNDLRRFTEINTFINTKFSGQFNKWTLIDFDQLFDEIDKYADQHEISTDDKNVLQSIKTKIKKILSPARRYHMVKSNLINAMEQGEWILIDDIESASPEIIHKLASLCGDDSEIDLFECGENYFFSRNKPNSRKIHDNFRIFITYNTSYKIESKPIDTQLQDRCILFTIPSIDSSLKSSSQYLAGSLMKLQNHNEVKYDLATNLAQRLANAYHYIKTQRKNKIESFNEIQQFTGLILTHVIKEFSKCSINNIDKIINRILHLYYGNSYINENKKEKFLKNVILQLYKEPQQNKFIFNIQNIKSKEKYEFLLTILRNIQLYANDDIETCDFNLTEFIEMCSIIQPIDIDFFVCHLQETANIIAEKLPIDNELDLKHLENYYLPIHFLCVQFVSLWDGIKKVDSKYFVLSFLNDNIDLLSIKYITNHIARMNLLYQLSKTNRISRTNPSLLYNDQYFEFFKLIVTMSYTPTLEVFNTFVSKLNENNELIPLLDNIFPYQLFKKNIFHMILYWMPQFIQLYKNKITFHINVTENSYDFEFDGSNSIEIFYIFNEKSSLDISFGSKIYDSNPKNEDDPISYGASKDMKDELELNSLYFYLLVDRYLNDQSQTILQLKENMSKNENTFPNSPSKSNYFPGLSKLYKNEINDPLISKSLAIVYDFSPDKIQFLSKILNPIESNVINIASYLYSNINNDRINDILNFIDKMSYVGGQKSILWLKLNNQYEYPSLSNIRQIKKEIKKIDKEIGYLENVPKLDIINHIWNAQKYINILELLKSTLKQLVDYDEKDDESLENTDLDIVEDEKINEKERIERVINRMEKTNSTTQFLNQPYENHQINVDSYKPDENIEEENYPVMPLINQSSIFSQPFIKNASELDLPWSTICMNILIDCSENINKENKIYNMMIICGLTEAVTTLGIPYSVSIIGDVGTTKTIKPFSENHSNDTLQKICDCYLIKRNRPDLPGCLRCAIDQMGYPEGSRENRMIITFTDGLDENLITIKQWSDIFKPKNLSFGFVFIKSAELPKEKQEFLEKVWNEFENDSKQKNPAISVAKIFDNNNNNFKNNDVTGNINSLTTLFRSSINGNSRTDEETLELNQEYKRPIFHIDSKLKSIGKCRQYLNKNYNNLHNIYVNKPDILVNDAPSDMGKLNRKLYMKNINRVSHIEVEESLSNDYHELLTNILNDNANEAETSPNDTETEVDNNSYQFEFNSFDDSQYYIKDSGNPDQNNNTNQSIFDIDNEYISNKGSTVIVDSSYSCLNTLSAPHSFQTIKNILSFLKNNDLPYFNLIVATDSSPIVLCSGVKTMKALSPESNLWSSLFSVLQNTTPSIKRADLGSAIHAALDLQRMRRKQNESSLFIITDGLYQKRERPRIIENINNCVQLKMRTYGVGIGIYPKGIDKLFPQVIYAQNPSNVMRGVSMLNYKVNEESPKQMAPINITYNPIKMERAIKSVKKKKKPVFSKLKNDLENAVTPYISNRDFINVENPEDKKKNINPTGENKELLIENYLETQQILIVNLCSDEQFDVKYLSQNKNSNNKECVKEAVKFFGISIEIVQNYEDAINEITKSKSEFCDYYAVWVISGSHPEKLHPNQRQTNVYLVEQFIDVLIKFWENGGSLVFWASKDPNTFHVNAFLTRVMFKNESRCPTGKVNFQIHGEHKGTQILSGDDTGELKQNNLFNRKPLLLNDIERSSISNNLYKIYEGSVKSFVENVSINDKDKISPFIPFEIDSEGGIASLFYASNTDNKTGDIVIDCCFDKLINDITKEGTYRYIQNIAGWTARPEIHKKLNEGPLSQWRPKAVQHTIINITESSYSEDIQKLIKKADDLNDKITLKKLVRENKGDADCFLRFTIKWNDVDGSYDRNDLDAHCIEPNFEIFYSAKTSPNTGGQLDIDITGPIQGVQAVENIRWKDLNRMEPGIYKLFVNQYDYRGGDTGFRAIIEFTNKDNISQYFYDYQRSLSRSGENVYVADVEYRNSKFTIEHKLTPVRSEEIKMDANVVSKSLSMKVSCERDPSNEFVGIINYLKRQSRKNDFFITASSQVNGHEPKNALLFNDHNKYFLSQNSTNSFIHIDFQMHLVNPTGYEIRTISNSSSGNFYPKSWRIEGSNNNSDWVLLDQQSNCSILNGPNKVGKFNINNSNNKEFRFIRLIQVGPNFNNDNTLGIDSFEIYGILNQHLDRFS